MLKYFSLIVLSFDWISVDVHQEAVTAHLFFRCQRRQQAFVLLLFCRCHNDEVIFFVKCTWSWLESRDKRKKDELFQFTIKSPATLQPVWQPDRSSVRNSEGNRKHTSVNSAPGQVILKRISSVKEGEPPLFAETPLQTSSSPPITSSSSPAISSPVRLLSSCSPLLVLGKKPLRLPLTPAAQNDSKCTLKVRSEPRTMCP